MLGYLLDIQLFNYAPALHPIKSNFIRVTDESHLSLLIFLLLYYKYLKLLMLYLLH